jgi:inorganic pyrophosphatase
VVMSKNGQRNGSRSALADPSRLAPYVDDDPDIFKVIIETPKGSRNKFAFDPEEKTYTLKKVLPAGMVFPYDFGFVPSTKAEDGDPVDVLVLMDEPAFPGCVIKVRLVGVIEGEQSSGKKTERNDRLIAVESANHQWKHIDHVDQLGKQFVKELGQFFVNYNELAGKEFKVLDVKGPGAARKCVECGIKAAKKS